MNRKNMKDLTEELELGVEQNGKEAKEMKVKETKTANGVGAQLVVPENFIQSAREQGIETDEALPELTDNSFDAGANNIEIMFREVSGDLWVIVADDGVGMPPEFTPTSLSFGGTGHFGSRAKIGRFGWGLPAASINQACRVEVYSKVKGQPFYMTYLDVEEIKSGKSVIPTAVQADPPKGAWPFSKSDSGTVVIWKNTDRIRWKKASTIKSHIIKELGRVYRRFILGGKRIVVDGSEVKPFDPLMLDDRCLFVEELGLGDSTIYNINPLEFENPVTHAKGTITFRFSYLNTEKITESAAKTGDASDEGGFKRKHKIGPAGSGFYVVRDDREIMAASALGGLITKHPAYNYMRAEIAFTPVLDEAFGIQVNKSRFSICEGLADKLRPLLEGLYAACEKRRSVESAKKRQKDVTKEPTAAESIAAQAENVLKKRKDTKDATQEIEKRVENVQRDEKSSDEEKVHVEGLKRALELHYPFKIHYKHNPHGPFYWVEYLGSPSAVYINAAHPFFTKVYERATQMEGLKEALDLIILTLAKAEVESIKGDNPKLKDFYLNEKIEWSTILRTYLDSAP